MDWKTGPRPDTPQAPPPAGPTRGRPDASEEGRLRAVFTGGDPAGGAPRSRPAPHTPAKPKVDRRLRDLLMVGAETRKAAPAPISPRPAPEDPRLTDVLARGASAQKEALAPGPTPPAPEATRTGKRNIAAPRAETRPETLRSVLKSCRPELYGVALFSAVMNILMLTGPLFMLQVYDRVLSSGSAATLLVLFSIVVFLYGVMGVLDNLRGRVLGRIGAAFQARLDRRVFDTVLKEARTPAARLAPATGLRDLANVQAFLSSPMLGAIFDLPWTPLFVVLLFIFHPMLGQLALFGGATLIALAILNQVLTRNAQAEADKLLGQAEAAGDRMRREIETLRGLGMVAPMAERWTATRAEALGARMASTDIGGRLTSATKALRLLLQSAMLAMGAWLALRGELSPGMMIAGTILLGRALAPVEQSIGQWGAVQRAHGAWTRLGELLAKAEDDAPPMPLPRPEGRFEVNGLTVVPPGQTAPTLQGIGFDLEPGEAMAVIGPSASGKSTLARALAGVWPAAKGEPRLGGAEIGQYDSDVYGRLIGYLPQDISLLPGSVHENIARFEPDAPPEKVVAAAEAAGAHEMILALAEGYNTKLHDAGGGLSGGQRQRIALARALYDNPAVLILDEPNANLDDKGLRALNEAISTAKAAGQSVVIIAHRQTALAQCEKVLMLAQGRMQAFGPREEVVAQFMRAKAEAPRAREKMAGR
ncbi:MAG: type I secretion system permease/ATPase [Paracoccaceae bacterium]|nr:type I secretion system permease/ATPase [Paracoccaceae bacterium]